MPDSIPCVSKRLRTQASIWTVGKPPERYDAMAATVRVWALPDLRTQHHALPPDDDTSREWDGETSCGLNATLRWVHGETVDRGLTCRACIAAAGVNPPLEGDDPGPV